MHALKKLIIKEWLRFFLASFIVFLILVSVGTLINGFLRENITAVEVIMSYFLELPSALNRVIPISCLIASLFSINKLKNRNELTAIFAAGFSRKNFLINIFQVSIFVALFQFLIGAYVEPFVKSRRHILIENSDAKFRNLKSKGIKASTIGSGLIWYKSKDYYFSFIKFDSKTNTIINTSIYYYSNDYHLARKVFADEVIYTEDGRWMGKNVTIISKIDEPTFPFMKTFPEYEIKLNETLDDFSQIEADITTLNHAELYQYIQNIKSSGLNVNEYLVVFYEKISSAVICIVFSLLACVPIFNPNRRNSSFGKNILFVFVFTIAYWLINSYSIELGVNSKLDPISSTFSVPIIFMLFLATYFYKNRKLT
ncbi:permease, YjgP/YjgQ family [Bacteriovorax sp. BSW11_IV]|uniref:LptF/LptG family permease n=1 Tax=Bacteriovorax sp. BSW11_IV TaxID=1353529 RepID=UPI000389FF26|nr:LptF/LptG family permease [Bacteriovorax sp. BSW11_IV]EQC50025.1 permease, YjgP/YjgQ family [Bacteriovorax sp. BSW11_IV]